MLTKMHSPMEIMKCISQVVAICQLLKTESIWENFQIVILLSAKQRSITLNQMGAITVADPVIPVRICAIYSCKKVSNIWGFFLSCNFFRQLDNIPDADSFIQKYTEFDYQTIVQLFGICITGEDNT